MQDIYFLLIVFLICWYFVFLRKLAERAKLIAQQHCKQQNLQFLEIARTSSKLRFSKRDGLHWLSVFEFDFSGDGESKYTGKLILRNSRLENVDLPAYRI